MISQLSWAMWDYITGFLSYIPKCMYFIYTAIASVLDALQLVFRKLAGLDVYYVDGEAIKNTDPVLEFIMGILGIGENAPAYSALTTTFWSLVIFGAIVLVLTTMFAIIKSHYNEDSGKTNPVTYIYTAIKSVLTFAIVPVVVIAGFWLSTFLLRTLDNITSASTSAETLEGIYGAQYNNVFTSSTDTKGNEVYGNFDIFSAGAGTNRETFSGLIFKTAARDANRMRTGRYNPDRGTTDYTAGILDGVVSYFGPELGYYYDFDIFGKNNIPAGQDKREWIAYQIDYAFANNLRLDSSKWTALEVIYNPMQLAIEVATTPSFVVAGSFVYSFTKYNVGFVWYYYDLWSFNFIIAGAAVIVLFGLMVSIILGLITRIIKSAALFLIYPALLGLAPLDEFGAFKKWRGEFMQQVLMAFGAVVGINLFFLLLPYLSNIQFFNITIMDYIMNLLIVIAGLSMVKAFIGFLSGLIGGADAVKTGDDAKAGIKEVGGKAIGGALAAANVAMKVGKFIPGMGMAFGAAEKGLRMARAKNKANQEQNKMGKAQHKIDLADDLLYGDKADAAFNNQAIAELKLQDHVNNYMGDSANAAKVRKADRMADAKGLTGADRDAFIRQQMQEEMLKDDSFADIADARAQKKISDQKGYTDRQWKIIQARDGQEAIRDQAKANMEAIRTSNYMDKDGKYVPDMEKQMVANDARALGGAIMKGLKDGMKDVGLNLSGLIGTFGRATNYKLDDKGKIDGVYGEAREAATTQKELDTRREQSRIARGRFVDSLAGVFTGYGNAGSKDPAPKTGDKLGQEQLKKTEDTNKKLDDLIKLMEKGIAKK